MINITMILSVIIYVAWVSCILKTLYYTLKQYNKWIYIYWDKKHSNEHIALLLWLIMIAITFSAWALLHIFHIHTLDMQILAEILWYLFIMKWVIYCLLSNHLFKELEYKK
jgi:hypothetical protein